MKFVATKCTHSTQKNVDKISKCASAEILSSHTSTSCHERKNSRWLLANPVAASDQHLHLQKSSSHSEHISNTAAAPNLFKPPQAHTKTSSRTEKVRQPSRLRQFPPGAAAQTFSIQPPASPSTESHQQPRDPNTRKYLLPPALAHHVANFPKPNQCSRTFYTQPPPGPGNPAHTRTEIKPTLVQTRTARRLHVVLGLLLGSDFAMLAMVSAPDSTSQHT